MAFKNCRDLNVCENSRDVSGYFVGGSVISRHIPVKNWTVWCYEKWRFAPKFGHLRKRHLCESN